MWINADSDFPFGLTTVAMELTQGVGASCFTPTPAFSIFEVRLLLYLPQLWVFCEEEDVLLVVLIGLF